MNSTGLLQPQPTGNWILYITGSRKSGTSTTTTIPSRALEKEFNGYF
jgi:hypothetical protein